MTPDEIDRKIQQVYQSALALTPEEKTPEGVVAFGPVVTVTDAPDPDEREPQP